MTDNTNKIAATKLREAANEIDPPEKSLVANLGATYAGLIASGIPIDMAESLTREILRGVISERIRFS